MSLSIMAAVAFGTFALSAWLTHRFSLPGSFVYVLDHPNDRSLHHRPVPRGGGLAILISLALSVALVPVFGWVLDGLAGMAIGAVLVAVVSFLDDRYSVPALYRLVAHAVAGSILLYSGMYLTDIVFLADAWEWPAAVGVAVLLVCVVWMINLYNFMDGMDGFAGGMSLFGFGTFAILGWMSGEDEFFLVSLVIAAAAAGFLLFNFPPARIFMGDIGASTLGFLASSLSLWGIRDGIFPFWVPLQIFSPFIADATVTLLQRLLRGEKVWEGHKKHYYQKLVQAGWGHRKTVLIEYVIMTGCMMSALAGLQASASKQMAIVSGWALFYFLFFSWASRLADRTLNPRGTL
jgi:UDP-N-acetylmuramyl pentapeptide phosphotransferase/UDP-N-acetylglucosamine-1-phosphate transferase